MELCVQWLFLGRLQGKFVDVCGSYFGSLKSNWGSILRQMKEEVHKNAIENWHWQGSWSSWKLESCRNRCRDRVMGVASVLTPVVGYVLSHIKKYELMEKRQPISVQHHKFPVLIKKWALQWNPQVRSFLEEKSKTILLLFEWTLCDLYPFPPWFFFLVNHMAKPRLDNKTTGYHHCSWQTAAFHPGGLINKPMTHKRFTQRWIWPLRPCHALI